MLIAGSNVANLLLARAQKRQREVAMRSALGAGRWRLIRQLCTENIVLSLLGCVLGVVIAQWMLDALLSGVPEFYERVLPSIAEISIDLRVLGFAIGLALLTGLVFGIGPALTATRGKLTQALKDGGTSTSGRSRLRLGRMLVTVEIAMSALLLVGAGLLLRSFDNLKNVDTGFHAPQVLSGQIDLPAARYGSEEKAIGFYDAMLTSVQSLPNVQAAGLVNMMPFSTSNSNRSIEVEGAEVAAAGERPRADYRLISDDYFKAMGIRMIQGRGLNGFDDADSLPIALVNERFVHQHLDGLDPIGSRVRVQTGDEAPWREIVGVVNNVLHHDLTSPPQAEIYVPYAQAPRLRMTLVVRTESDPIALASSIRLRVGAVDPDLPLFGVQSVDQAVSQAMFVQSMLSMMMGGFALVALLLSCVGLYGLISYTVSQRSSEIGLRMAFGAKGLDVIWLVLRSGLPMTLVGVGLGLAMAFVAARLIAGQLFALTPTDPATYGTVTALVMLIALLAHYVPARRATRIDPMQALRCE
jgi:putative ABC transport system permease protein